MREGAFTKATEGEPAKAMGSEIRAAADISSVER